MRAGRRPEMLRGVASALALVGLAVGPPVLLTTQVGWPLPTKVPSIDDLRFAVTVGIEHEVVVNALAVVLWLAWAYVVVAIALQVVAMVAGRTARQLGGLPRLERVLGELVASASLVLSSAGATYGSSAMLTAAAPALAPYDPAQAADSARTSTQPADSGRQAPMTAPRRLPGVQHPDGATRAPRAVDVGRHDSYWGIAERELGDGLRWRELRDVNVGRKMPDGEVIAADSDEVTPRMEACPSHRRGDACLLRPATCFGGRRDPTAYERCRRHRGGGRAGRQHVVDRRGAP